VLLQFYRRSESPSSVTHAIYALTGGISCGYQVFNKIIILITIIVIVILTTIVFTGYTRKGGNCEATITNEEVYNLQLVGRQICAISELSIKIPISPLDSAAQISQKEYFIWR